MPYRGSKPGASKALDNLESVAINASLISDTDITDDLGSSAKKWNNLYASHGRGFTDLFIGDDTDYGVKLHAFGNIMAIGDQEFIGAAADTSFDYYSAFYTRLDTKDAYFENYGGGIRIVPASGTDLIAVVSVGNWFRIYRGASRYLDFGWISAALAKMYCNYELEIETAAEKDITLDPGSTRVNLEHIMKFTPGAAPGTPETGDLYYDSAANKLKVYTGAAWETITSA